MTERIKRDPLLAAIDVFLKAHDMGETYFGTIACGNSTLVPRLRAGGGCTRNTEEKCFDFMANYEPRKKWSRKKTAA